MVRFVRFLSSWFYFPEVCMPTLNIDGTVLEYADADIISFAEGLIGMPHLRRMALIQRSDVEPFLWLAAIDQADTAFLVVDPRIWIPDFAESVSELLPGARSESMAILAIVTIATDWVKSTVNLRAPILISPATMRGAQVILTSSAYSHNEPLPHASAACN
jgi:flagellar assembly factor FliW